MDRIKRKFDLLFFLSRLKVIKGCDRYLLYQETRGAYHVEIAFIPEFLTEVQVTQNSSSGCQVVFCHGGYTDDEAIEMLLNLRKKRQQ